MLDMAFEGANREFERFTRISATPTPNGAAALDTRHGIYRDGLRVVA
jgi:hypothetical protein